MCTMIAQQVEIKGSGKAGSAWFKMDTASISYDHPFDMPLEYTLNLDFTNQASRSSTRLAVELDVVSAKRLLEAIQEVMRQADQGGFLK